MFGVRRLVSKIDQSVNFIFPNGRSVFEARYVARPNRKHISLYVSSHDGCRMGCKMCHLTATKQNTMTHLSPMDYARQISVLMDWHRCHPEHKDRTINVNFMARGEPLMNVNVVNHWSRLWEVMCGAAMRRDMRANISTIMPHHMATRSLKSILGNEPNVYYSLYSFNPEWRRKWLPGAMNPILALEKLMDYNRLDGGPVPTLHWAFIKGENDSKDDVYQMVRLFRMHDIRARLNIVLYNPVPNTEETPTDMVKWAFERLNTALGSHSDSKIVPRVGTDVYASCGTFIA